MVNKLIPLFVRNLLRPFFVKYRILSTNKKHRKQLKKTRGKDSIKVAFIVVYESMWKYDKLYFLLEKDRRFELQVFICPFVTYGEDVMNDEMERSFDSFSKRGYQVVKTLRDDGSWLDIKNEFNPDLVFFTNPWRHTLDNYLILNFLDRLTCYVPYGFNSSNLYNEHFNMDMQKLCWTIFAETEFHKKLSENYADNKGKNFIVTGYPGIDPLIDANYKSKDGVWKSQNMKKKRIIWAPHHTINNGEGTFLNYSTFLNYADWMLDIAYDYQDEIQICFKPHPNLRGKLNDEKVWGVERTNLYFDRWMNLVNGQLNEGEYMDLFLQSDAMIHDSGSFVLEYLFIKKPVMFLIGSDIVYEQFNGIGKKALNNMEKGYSKLDVELFIQRVVKGEDKYSVKRNAFVENNLMPPNNKLASNNIYDYLVEQLF